jgi:uncharacterized protein YkwD
MRVALSGHTESVHLCGTAFVMVMRTADPRKYDIAYSVTLRANLTPGPTVWCSITMTRIVRIFLLLLLWTPAGASEQVRSKPQVVPSDLEQRVLELINAERAKQNLRPLELDLKLAEIARAHSRDMVKQGYFNHITPEGRGPAERSRAAGYECRKRSGDFTGQQLAENLFQNNLYDRVVYQNGARFYEWKSAEEIAKSSVKGWMKSPGHRGNILNPGYDKTGIGVAIGADGKVILTQLFC